MKKIVLVVALATLLASCSFTDTVKILTTRSSGTPATATTTTTTTTPDNSTKKEVVKEGDTVGVDYVGRLEDGTIFDSSIEEFAKKTKNYTPGGRTYEPLSFTVGAGQMIKGFDAGVVGMKLGEKKTLTIAPKDAYGEAFKEESAPLKYFQDRFTEEVPEIQLQDTITQTVSKASLGSYASDLVVGKVIDAGNTTAKVVKVDGDQITIAIDNKQNPFYGKKLKEGLRGAYQENEIVVKKIANGQVTLEIVNKANPFYGKKLKEGLTAKTKDGQEVTIAKIDGDNVTIRVPNTHELAGKTLIFDVEVKSIK